MEYRLPWELTIAQLLKKRSAFYGIREFIADFTTARDWTLSFARLIQSTPSHSISSRSFYFSSHLRLGLPNSLSPSSFSTKIYMFLPSHPPWFDCSDNVRREAQIMKLLIAQFLPPAPVTEFLSQISSVYILPFEWVTKLQTHIKQATLRFCIFYSFRF
jgi:hypothetical protein